MVPLFVCFYMVECIWNGNGGVTRSYRSSRVGSRTFCTNSSGVNFESVLRRPYKQLYVSSSFIYFFLEEIILFDFKEIIFILFIFFLIKKSKKYSRLFSLQVLIYLILFFFNLIYLKYIELISNFAQFYR